MMAKVKDKVRRRVWIDSQTEEEILRGIREAKDLKEYDNLAASAYLRAKEDYLMGINFSRLLSLKYGNSVANFLGSKYQVISVGRVMTCVLGMVVRREREIRDFVKTPFYRLIAGLELEGCALEGEWRVNPESLFFQSPALYKENGFREEKDAKALANKLSTMDPLQAVVLNIEKKKEKKNPPLLYNLAELQNECSRLLKTSPDETLRIVQELYERKLVTYPRTDARVLSSAVAKVIAQNLRGLRQYGITAEFTDEVLQKGSYQGLAKTRYVNDRQITDHYAIIPTGQGISGLAKLPAVSQKVYELVVRRFLSIFYPPAQYRKLALTTGIGKETFFTNARVLLEQGYLKVIQASFLKKKEEEDNGEASGTPDLADILEKLKKNQILQVRGFEIKEGETAPPKRYNSGSIILAMENAGQLIEDEELRAQIKGSGIGTSATRAEILKKLVANKYMALNKKTQILTPTMLGEMIFDVVNSSIRSLLNPELTASWEKGLTYVAEGSITEDEYMQKLEKFITDRTTGVLRLNNQYQMRNCYQAVSEYYQKGAKKNG